MGSHHQAAHVRMFPLFCSLVAESRDQITLWSSIRHRHEPMQLSDHTPSAQSAFTAKKSSALMTARNSRSFCVACLSTNQRPCSSSVDDDGMRIVSLAPQPHGEASVVMTMCGAIAAGAERAK